MTFKRSSFAAALGAIFALIGAASPSTAGVIRLGSTFQMVKSSYTQAVDAQLDGRHVLELTDVDYAGVHWAKVDFIFDTASRLAKVTLTTQTGDFDEVLAMAQAENQAAPGISLAADRDTGHEMQMRVCQSEDGVTLSYEPETAET